MKRCGLGFLTPSYGFAYKRGKYIGVVTRNESVRMVRSRTGRQRPQTLATAAPDGGSGLKGTEMPLRFSEVLSVGPGAQRSPANSLNRAVSAMTAVDVGRVLSQRWAAISQKL